MTSKLQMIKETELARRTLTVVTTKMNDSPHRLYPFATDLIDENGSLLWRTEHASEAAALAVHDGWVRRSMPPSDDPDAPVHESPIIKIWDEEQ